MTGLQWQDVDLVKHHALVHPDQSKSKEAIPVPLNDGAIAIIRKQMVNIHNWFFLIKEIASSNVTQKHSVRLLNEQAYLILDGMIYVTLGQVGMYKMGQHYMSYKS